jgi:REP element-mobilizing transposase RayT
MSRPLRIEFEGAFYHITARGNERGRIFLIERDFTRFLDRLEQVYERYGVVIHAYVLMSNHYHLLLETPRGNVTAALHDLNTAYTNYFNRRHDRVGHLFQGRYRAILVDKDNYLLELSRYIHLNPVRAGMVRRPEAYRWSSYSSYLYSGSSPQWLRREDVLGRMDKNLRRGRLKYRQFVEEGLVREVQDPLDEVIGGIALGGERFWESLRKRLEKMKGESEVPGLRQIRRKTDVGRIVEEVAAFYGILEEKIIQRGYPPHPGSQVAIYLARKKTDLSLNEIGNFFGGRHYTAVSAAFRRVEARRQQDPKVDRELNKIEGKLA